MNRARRRELRAGLVVLMAISGYFALVSLAGTGPGFLGSRRTIDVVFRDAQGLRPGASVRIAGIEAGRVTGVDLTEREGILWARVRLSVTSELAHRLRQDARVTIQAGLTGAPSVNIVSSGRSEVALVPGQVVVGVESSFFDPVLEQVGLGPVERSHLSHTIAEVRQTVDTVGPRLRQVVGTLQETALSLRETADTVRPSIEATAGRVENITRKLDEVQFDQTLKKADTLLTQTQGILEENRASIQGILGGTRDLLATQGPKLDALVEGINGTRVRVDHFLGQASTLTATSNDLLTKNRANLDRTLSNVKEATDHGVALVQKLRGNPFYLSPFYKPTKEDIHAQEVYDAAGTILMASKELNDAITKIQSIRSTKPLPQMTTDEQKYYNQLFQRAWTLQSQLEQTNQSLAAGLRQTIRR